ncbi:MAG TPA: HD domain-containing phosphohydrolase, partial [Negativicutes bacterium]|nr:HD domain-containing phosphohydrolase [Negativicutes bacterium]
ENFDGSGYTRGLAGDDIHLYARIVAVADNFDAVTSDRPYRRAYLPHEACDILRRSRGTKLDPRIVNTFLEAVPICRPGCR